jgi:carboxynorspermidine decarboxylase
MLDKIKTPAYICEEKLLEQNLQILDKVQKRSGAKILLALKGFALWGSFDLISKYLYGVCASGLWEAKLGFEEMKKEIHTYSPAFQNDEIEEIATISNHIIFNSFNQLIKYHKIVKKINPNISIGLRINLEYSEVTPEIYNPCSKFSRYCCK